MEAKYSLAGTRTKVRALAIYVAVGDARKLPPLLDASFAFDNCVRGLEVGRKSNLTQFRKCQGLSKSTKNEKEPRLVQQRVDNVAVKQWNSETARLLPKLLNDKTTPKVADDKKNNGVTIVAKYIFWCFFVFVFCSARVRT